MWLEIFYCGNRGPFCVWRKATDGINPSDSWCQYNIYSWFCMQGWRTPWWSHQMETFSSLLAICAGNSPVSSEFPEQRPVTRSFDVFFDLHPNKRLSKQWWGWWFETPSCPLWRHRNDVIQWASWPLDLCYFTLNKGYCGLMLIQKEDKTANNCAIFEVDRRYMGLKINIICPKLMFSCPGNRDDGSVKPNCSTCKHTFTGLACIEENLE